MELLPVSEVSIPKSNAPMQYVIDLEKLLRLHEKGLIQNKFYIYLVIKLSYSHSELSIFCETREENCGYSPYSLIVRVPCRYVGIGYGSRGRFVRLQEGVHRLVWRSQHRGLGRAVSNGESMLYKKDSTLKLTMPTLDLLPRELSF